MQTLRHKYSLLLLMGMLFLAGCTQNPSPEADFSTPIDTSPVQLEAENYETINDFSELDRSIVTHPITYKECFDKNGSGSVEYLEEYERYSCQDGDTHYTFSPKHDQLETLHLNYDENTYTLNENISLVASILKHIKMPVAEQNGLIEMMNLDPSQRQKQKPDIPLVQPLLSRKHQKNKLILETSGPFLKDFEIKREQGLWVQKTSDRKDEPHLYMNINGVGEIYLEDLKNPAQAEAYQLSAFDLINQKIKPYLGKNLTLDFFTIKREWDENHEEIQEITPYLTIELQNLTYEDFGNQASLCQGLICFDSEKPIYHYKNRYYQSRELPETETEHHILRNNETRQMIYRNPQFMNTDIWRNQPLGDRLLEWFFDENCGPTTLRQQINAQEIEGIPQVLTFFGEAYQLQPLNLQREIGLWSTDAFGIVENIDQPFESPQDAEQKITQLIQDKLTVYNTYLIRFKAYPNLIFAYSNPRFEGQNPLSIVKREKKLTINSDHDLTDLEQTRSIFCEILPAEFDFVEGTCPPQAQEPRAIWGTFLMLSKEKAKKADIRPIKDGYGEELIFTRNLLPLFKIQESKIVDHYFVFSAENVDFADGGYGCKPVIYTYDQHERDNHIQIKLPAHSKFTKLVPAFSTGTMWNFTTDKDSNIQIQGQTYPYLYYSTLRTHYQNNRYGRNVASEDIEFFLNDKLDKMNFNQKEKADFLEYWLPEFERWYVYSISFKFDEEFAPYAQLQRKHAPERSFRVFMEAHQHPQNTHVSFDRQYPNAGDQQYLRRFERGSSFDMLEWGGNLTKLYP